MQGHSHAQFFCKLLVWHEIVFNSVFKENELEQEPAQWRDENLKKKNKSGDLKSFALFG